jgi:exopolysaccharide biosynthesis polyprenyl glycosylphosphotransferase
MAAPARLPETRQEGQPHIRGPGDASVQPVDVPQATKGLRRRLIELDAVCIASSWCIALVIGLSDGRISRDVWQVVLEIACLTALGVGLLAAMHLYRSRVTTMRSITLERTALVAVILAGTAWGVERLLKAHPPVSVALLGGALTFVTLSVARACFDAWVTLLRRNGSLSRPVVLVGGAPEVAELSELLFGHPEMGYRPVGYMSDGPSNAPGLATIRWIGPSSRGDEGVRSVHATGAVIAANGLSSAELNRIVRELHRAGLHVHLSSGLFRIGHRRVRQLPLAHEPFFYLEPPTPRRSELAAKRALDVVGATTILIITSPLTLFAAALIKLSDRGPVLFKQVRVGQHGEEFMIHKLRTMTIDAERQFEALQSQNDRVGPLFKMADDPRVTRVGRWLRASSIDELPQLFDVLTGRLSLVGPRPALPAEVEQFDDELMGRQRIRPGVTGLWQVEARHNSSFYAYRHLDLFYLENWTLGLDITIGLATLRCLVSDAFDSIGRVRERRRAHRDQQETPLPAYVSAPSPIDGEHGVNGSGLAPARFDGPTPAIAPGPRYTPLGQAAEPLVTSRSQVN